MTTFRRLKEYEEEIFIVFQEIKVGDVAMDEGFRKLGRVVHPLIGKAPIEFTPEDYTKFAVWIEDFNLRNTRKAELYRRISFEISEDANIGPIQ